MTTVADLLTEGVAALAAAGIGEARPEARLLLSHATGLDAAKLFGYPEREIGDAAAAAYRDLLTRRAARTPIAHLTGMREFWSLPFKVTPATLVPRPDSEAVIDLALELFAGRTSPRTILDLGTGTGCLLLALLSVFPDARGVAVDISEDALAVARENAVALGFDARTTFVRGDFAHAPDGPFDLVVSNPPYIRSADIDDLERDVRAYDPHLALDGGADGLDAYRAIIVGLASRLDDGGHAIFEIGIGQADDVAAIAESFPLMEGPERRDLNDIVRAVSFYKKGVGKSGSVR